jgi:hypothetical protein
MNEQAIQDLKAALQEIMQLITARGQLSEEMKGMLAQVMEHVAGRIQELRAEGVPATPSEPPLNKEGPSSNVHSFGYDPENGKLMVKFQGKYPQENGPVYSYGGVPQVIFELFRKGAVPARTDGQNKWGKWWKGKVPSLGASLYTLIKNGGYPYQRVG